MGVFCVKSIDIVRSTWAVYVPGTYGDNWCGTFTAHKPTYKYNFPRHINSQTIFSRTQIFDPLCHPNLRPLVGERQRKKERGGVQGRRLPMAVLMDWINRWLVWEMTP